MGASQLELFLRREATKDEIAREVYAEWLDTKGDPRGELIRINTELENLNPEVGLKPCIYCNPDGKLTRDIHPTNCKQCANQSGWLEITDQATRERYNRLIDRRLEILNSLPQRWYGVFSDNVEIGCSLGINTNQAVKNLVFKTVIFVANAEYYTRLIQTAIPYEL